MVVRVERVVHLDAPIDGVWGFVGDPDRRAGAISVVEDYERRGDETVWHVRLPIIGTTVAVTTEEVEREDPTYVRFVGRSRAFHVEGEHELVAVDGGTELTNRFVVQGRLPGIETFFERRLGTELDNLEAALRTALDE